LNKLEKKIEVLFSKKNNSIGFGKSLATEKKRKLLLFVESNNISKNYNDLIDGFLIIDLEFDNLTKIEDERVIGLKYPDKILDLEKINKCNYDFVIVEDLKLSYKYLNNDTKTIFKVDENISDETADIISSFDFPILFIELSENLNFKDLQSFFNLSKIVSKFNNNFILKVNSILNTDQIQILYNLGIIGLVLDSKYADIKTINKFNDNLINLNTEKKKQDSIPDLSSNYSSSSHEDDFDD
tara:strand:+ start:1739 stop:2461 length:723 start_codon:yes stop_codon:yes gene_type:complete